MIAHLDSTHRDRMKSEDPATVSDKKSKGEVGKQSFQAKLHLFSQNAGQLMHLSQAKVKEIDSCLMDLFIINLLPFNLVEDDSFKVFVKSMEPRYNPPCKKKMITDLHKLKDVVETNLKKELSGAMYVAITHDAWTSINVQSFDTVTVHYITESWQLNSATLQTKLLQGSHTGENIAANLKETIMHWNLPQPIGVTENAANEQKAFEILEWQRIGCFGHRLNLVVKAGLGVTEISRIIARGRSLVSHFHRSSLSNEILMEKQILLLPEKAQGHKLINDVQTRWNSTLDMLQRLVEQTPALHAAVMDPKLGSRYKDLKTKIFSFEEQAEVENLIEVLIPFKKATEILSADKNITVHKVLPSVIKLEQALEKKAENNSGVEVAKGIMRKQLESRFLDKDFFILACLLHPETKQLAFLKPNEREHARTLLWDEIKDLEMAPVIKLEKKDDPVTEDNGEENEPPLPTLFLDSESESEDEERLERPTKKLKSDENNNREVKSSGWLDDIICTGTSQQKTQEELARNELDLFMAEKATASDPLEWWKNRQYLYPRISRIAKKILCVPSSSVSSERVFSLAGNVVNKKRSQLAPENINMMIFLKKNRQFFP